MIGCSRCGRWHTDAEDAEGKNLSCTDVKKFWGRIRQEHFESTGHLPQITADADGNWICLRCNSKLPLR